ncbi:MAG: sulfhydrogenase subunit delta [Pontibacterium sp.]
MSNKPLVAVHKFSSCDGCQLAFLNMGAGLLELAEQVALVHFPEAGPVAEARRVDIAFVEGSIVTAHDAERIKMVRANSQYLVTIGACATSGGIQALKNLAADREQWPALIYAQPDYIDSLPESKPISAYVKVDFELWGCPINSEQIKAVVASLLAGVVPRDETDKLCLECKRQQIVCTLVTQGKPCMGPVTRTGCGALCPRFGRDCYGCYGPAENTNARGLARCFTGLGLLPEQVRRKLHLIHPAAPGLGVVTIAGEDEHD